MQKTVDERKYLYKVNFTYVRLCKKNVGKIADFGVQFPFKGYFLFNFLIPVGT